MCMGTDSGLLWWWGRMKKRILVFAVTQSLIFSIANYHFFFISYYTYTVHIQYFHFGGRQASLPMPNTIF